MTGADLSREGFFRSSAQRHATSQGNLFTGDRGFRRWDTDNTRVDEERLVPKLLNLIGHKLGFNSFRIQRRHHGYRSAVHIAPNGAPWTSHQLLRGRVKGATEIIESKD